MKIFNFKSFKNREIKRNMVLLKFFDVVFFVSLTLVTVYKAFKGRGLITNILFNDALFYITLSVAFAFASSYSILGLIKNGNRKFLKKILITVICLLLCVAFIYIIIGDISSSFYRYIPDELNVITASDVFNIKDLELGTSDAEQVRLWHPFINTTISEVQQSFSKKNNNYFYSLKIISSNKHLAKLKNEFLRILCNEYSANYKSINQHTIIGEFNNNQTYRFVLRDGSGEMHCIIFCGKDFLAQKITLPLSDGKY